MYIKSFKYNVEKDDESLTKREFIGEFDNWFIKEEEKDKYDVNKAIQDATQNEKIQKEQGQIIAEKESPSPSSTSSTPPGMTVESI